MRTTRSGGTLERPPGISDQAQAMDEKISDACFLMPVRRAVILTGTVAVAPFG